MQLQPLSRRSLLPFLFRSSSPAISARQSYTRRFCRRGAAKPDRNHRGGGHCGAQPPPRPVAQLTLGFLSSSFPITMALLDSPRSISSSDSSVSSQTNVPLLPTSSHAFLFASAAQASSTPPRSARKNIVLLGAGAFMCILLLAWNSPYMSDAVVVQKVEREPFISPARRLSSANEERRGEENPAGVEEVSVLGRVQSHRC